MKREKGLSWARIPGQSMFANRPEENFVDVIAIEQSGIELTFTEK